MVAEVGALWEELQLGKLSLVSCRQVLLQKMGIENLAFTRRAPT